MGYVFLQHYIIYLKLYSRSIRNRDWDKLKTEKEEDLFMRENKMGDCNRHLNSKLFVPNNYSPIFTKDIK